MPRCPACDEWLGGDPEEIGARCSHCRRPLYERPELFKPRASAPDSFCTVHPGNPAVGACQRCGNFQCALCRTRWSGRWLCVACVNRALEANEARPEEVRTQFRQSILALVFGILGWVLMVLGMVLMVTALNAGENALVPLVLLGMAVLLGSPALAILGVGQGAAALRARGSHMILATIGLILSGLQVGALIGLFTFSFWRN